MQKRASLITCRCISTIQWHAPHCCPTCNDKPATPRW